MIRKVEFMRDKVTFMEINLFSQKIQGMRSWLRSKFRYRIKLL